MFFYPFFVGIVFKNCSFPIKTITSGCGRTVDLCIFSFGFLISAPATGHYPVVSAFLDLSSRSVLLRPVVIRLSRVSKNNFSSVICGKIFFGASLDNRIACVKHLPCMAASVPPFEQMRNASCIGVRLRRRGWMGRRRRPHRIRVKTICKLIISARANSPVNEKQTFNADESYQVCTKSLRGSLRALARGGE